MNQERKARRKRGWVELWHKHVQLLGRFDVWVGQMRCSSPERTLFVYNSVVINITSLCLWEEQGWRLVILSLGIIGPLLFPAFRELSFSLSPLYLIAHTQRKPIFPSHHCPECVSCSEVIFIFLLCKWCRRLNLWSQIYTQEYDLRGVGETG